MCGAAWAWVKLLSATLVPTSFTLQVYKSFRYLMRTSINFLIAISKISRGLFIVSNRDFPFIYIPSFSVHSWLNRNIYIFCHKSRGRFSSSPFLNRIEFAADSKRGWKSTIPKRSQRRVEQYFNVKSSWKFFGNSKAFDSTLVWIGRIKSTSRTHYLNYMAT